MEGDWKAGLLLIPLSASVPGLRAAAGMVVVPRALVSQAPVEKRRNGKVILCALGILKRLCTERWRASLDQKSQWESPWRCFIAQARNPFTCLWHTSDFTFACHEKGFCLAEAPQPEHLRHISMVCLWLPDASLYLQSPHISSKKKVGKERLSCNILCSTLFCTSTHLVGWT